MKRVVVAMSGGVDSSVAAYILKKEGLDVIGMSMQILESKQEWKDNFGKCCSPDDIYDARRVSENLKIPFYVINLEEKFKDEVINYFGDEYFKGRTPNPCIICNFRLKFYHLLRRAKEIGADFIATGHYARIMKDSLGFHLYKGVDGNKDQSYFLFSLNQEQLKSILFPLGNMTKAEVRKIALEAGFRTANKKESQEICFVEDSSYSDFLENFYKDRLKGEGDFISDDGKFLGRHKGIYHYTIGQRKGLGISHKRPLYVLKIDPIQNCVVLSEGGRLFRRELSVKGVSWILGKSMIDEGGIMTKVRYKTPEAKSRLQFLDEKSLKVVFEKPQRAVTPGQAAVFYKGEEVLGGGWIESY